MPKVISYGFLIERHETAIQELDAVMYKYRKLQAIIKERPLDPEELLLKKDIKRSLEVANRTFIKTGIKVNDFLSEILGGNL